MQRCAAHHAALARRATAATLTPPAQRARPPPRRQSAHWAGGPPSPRARPPPAPPRDDTACGARTISVGHHTRGLPERTLWAPLRVRSRNSSMVDPPPAMLLARSTRTSSNFVMELERSLIRSTASRAARCTVAEARSRRDRPAPRSEPPLSPSRPPSTLDAAATSRGPKAAWLQQARVSHTLTSDAPPAPLRHRPRPASHDETQRLGRLALCSSGRLMFRLQSCRERARVPTEMRSLRVLIGRCVSHQPISCGGVALGFATWRCLTVCLRPAAASAGKRGAALRCTSGRGRRTAHWAWGVAS